MKPQNRHRKDVQMVHDYLSKFLWSDPTAEEAHARSMQWLIAGRTEAEPVAMRWYLVQWTLFT